MVFIGRYHCASDYTSKTEVFPKKNTINNFLEGCHSLSNAMWLLDFPAKFTIWLLYLVEFADWDSQEKIGYGCGKNDSKTYQMGYTDSMPYHTGTTLSNRTIYGASTQYRNIEGLWDNVYDWLNGIYTSWTKDSGTSVDPAGLSAKLRFVLNPNEMTSISSSSFIGITLNVPAFENIPTKLSTTTTIGYSIFYPIESSKTGPISDEWNIVAISTANNGRNPISSGGAELQTNISGLFRLRHDSFSATQGGRLMELP